MVTTVKVIFLGLIGFVPSPEGRNDVAALLVDPARLDYHETECPVPEHISWVFLLHGQCESSSGTCFRATDELLKKAGRMGLGGFLNQFPQLLRKDRRKQGLGDQGNTLLWFLDREDLNITGDGDERLDFHNPFLAFLQGVAPQSTQQSAYFSWVPSMDELTRGRGQIKHDCRQGHSSCPLEARFLIEGGEMGACHLFHDLSNSPARERDVRIFEYLIPGERRVQKRAVADAVQVSFHEEERYVILESKNLPGRPSHDVKAVLTPDDKNRITLIVADLPGCVRDLKKNSSEHYCHHAHSDALFQLLENDRVLLPLRIMNEERRSADPGSCEEEIKELPPLFLPCLLEYPHAITACDGTRFPKPNQ